MAEVETLSEHAYQATHFVSFNYVLIVTGLPTFVYLFSRSPKRAAHIHYSVALICELVRIVQVEMRNMISSEQALGTYCFLSYLLGAIFVSALSLGAASKVTDAYTTCAARILLGAVSYTTSCLLCAVDLDFGADGRVGEWVAFVARFTPPLVHVLYHIRRQQLKVGREITIPAVGVLISAFKSSMFKGNLIGNESPSGVNVDNCVMLIILLLEISRH